MHGSYEQSVCHPFKKQLFRLFCSLTFSLVATVERISWKMQTTAHENDCWKELRVALFSCLIQQARKCPEYLLLVLAFHPHAVNMTNQLKSNLASYLIITLLWRQEFTLMSTMSPRLYTFKYVDKCVTPFFLNWRENMYRVPRRIPFGFVILLPATNKQKTVSKVKRKQGPLPNIESISSLSRLITVITY